VHACRAMRCPVWLGYDRMEPSEEQQRPFILGSQASPTGNGGQFPVDQGGTKRSSTPYLRLLGNQMGKCRISRDLCQAMCN
jgi:hypothetical protein